MVWTHGPFNRSRQGSIAGSLSPGLAADCIWAGGHEGPLSTHNPGVDAGEASAIGYALQQMAAGAQVLLLIDDRCGRLRALAQCLALRGLLPQQQPVAAVLRQAGEPEVH